jgi:hypothetical protein
MVQIGPSVLRRGYRHVTNSLQLGGVGKVDLGVEELGPQPRHVDVDGPRLHEPVAAPHEVEQLVAAEHPAGRADQRRQQLELGDLESLAIDFELAGLEVAAPGRRLTALAATGDRADAGEQLARREGLGDGPPTRSSPGS